jgi:hypothetical protein
MKLVRTFFSSAPLTILDLSPPTDFLAQPQLLTH